MKFLFPNVIDPSFAIPVSVTFFFPLQKRSTQQAFGAPTYRQE